MRRSVLLIPYLLLLAACGAPASPTPDAARIAEQVRGNELTQVALQSTPRAATQTAMALVNPSQTPIPQTTPTVPRPTPTGGPKGSGARANSRDFTIVAYQGEEILGGPEVAFSRVFAHGQPVVLNFWAPLCPPCVEEMPAFQRVADEYAGRVIFVGVDIGAFRPELGNQDEARQLLDDLEIRYPAAYAVDNPNRLYNFYLVPTTVFFRADGTVVKQSTGMLSERELRATVKRLVD